MSAVVRLVTFADLDDAAGARQVSVSLRQEAELVDGRRLLLLDDRGWAVSGGGASGPWPTMSAEEIEETSRVVVGPDEPFGGHSRADMEADHWAALAADLRGQGVVVDWRELERLPHDVVLSERLLARVGRAQGDDAP
ncbi:hypothetical protein [Qaidamihabitans albus]|uniref:hypothetical protein n=1 Tax=Qaidamihabitans albus TaxID=2795733 RepID=UPI0018F272EC|nr:hypothetical protein [Qaidamihabitans albus]